MNRLRAQRVTLVQTPNDHLLVSLSEYKPKSLMINASLSLESRVVQRIETSRVKVSFFFSTTIYVRRQSLL